MRLTSCVTRPVNNPYAWTYPCLGISLNKPSSLIVLFYAVKSGVVMGTESLTFTVGHNSSHWDMDQFEPFYGSVTLTNHSDGARGA